MSNFNFPGSMATGASYQPRLPLRFPQQEEIPMNIVQGFPVPPSVIPQLPPIMPQQRPTFKQKVISTAQEAFEHLQEVGNLIKQQQAIKEAGGVGNLARNSLLAYAIGQASGGNTAPLEGVITAHTAIMQARQKRELEEATAQEKFGREKELEDIKGKWGVVKKETEGTTKKEVEGIKQEGAAKGWVAKKDVATQGWVVKERIEGKKIAGQADVAGIRAGAAITVAGMKGPPPPKPPKPSPIDTAIVDMHLNALKDPSSPTSKAYFKNLNNNPLAQQEYLQAYYNVTGREYSLVLPSGKKVYRKGYNEKVSPPQQPAKKPVVTTREYQGETYKGSYNKLGGFDVTHKLDKKTKQWVDQ